MALSIQRMPLCCGIAVVTGFGNDPRHPHRDSPSIEDITRYLADAQRFGVAGAGRFADGSIWPGNVSRVGMLLAAVNMPQREFMAPVFRQLGWRRAGKCQNIHGGRVQRGQEGYSEVYLYRKVLADAADD